MSKLGFTTFLAIIYSGIMYLLQSCSIPGVCIRIHLLTHIFILIIILAVFVFRISRFFSTRKQTLMVVFFYAVFYYFTAYQTSRSFVNLLLELILVLVAFYLTHQEYISIREIHRTESRLTFSDIKYDVGLLEDAAKITESYIGRSRREKEPLSFLVVRYEPVTYKQAKATFKARLSDLFVERRLERNALRTILSNIRETDSFIETKDGCIILLPNTTKKQSECFIERLTENFERDMGFKLIIRTAEFPVDGETYKGLLNYCEGDLL